MARPMSRRDFVRTALGGAAGIALGGSLIGCSDDATTTTAGGVSTTAGAATSTTAAGPTRGGALRVALIGGGTTDTVDPNTLLSSPDFARTISLYEPLTFRQYDWTLGFILAEEVIPGAAADEWTVRLRDGIEFHNGKTLTADDVIFSFQRAFNPESPGLGAAQLGGVVDLNQITKVDDRTLDFKLLKPFAAFPEFLGLGVTILPEGYDPAAPVGTGPWKFKSFTPGDRSVFERFENYWDGPAYIDTLEIINFPDPVAAANAVSSGEVEIFGNLDYSQIAQLESQGLSILKTECNIWNPFVMRSDVPPFNDPKVREAMRLIVDREQLVQQVFAGNGRVGNDLYSPLDAGYLSEAPQRTQDIERAKSLLAEAGQSDLTLDLASVFLDPAIPAMVQVFAQQAAAAGVTINVQNMTPDQFFSTQYFQAPLQPDFWSNEAYLFDTSLAQLGGAPYNSGWFDDPEFAALYDEAQAQLDEAKRIEVMKQMQQIQYDRGNFIIWGFADAFDAYDPKVKGFTEGTQSVFGLNDFDFHRLYIE